MKHKTGLFALLLSGIMGLAVLGGCGGTTPPDVDPDHPDPDVPGEPGVPDEPVIDPDAIASPAFTDQSVTLDLKTTVSGTPRRISDSLFGVFLEDINYAGYLLDDNLLFNGSFETFDGVKTKGWTANGATVSVSNSDGLLAGTAYSSQGVNANYAEVTVTQAGGGISNVGPEALPIAVKEGGKYLFSAFVKAQSAANMTVKVKDAAKTYMEKTVAVEAGEWVKYQAELTASGTAAEGVSFELSFDGTGVYLLDGIQLETLDSTAGIKQYVYDAIKELSPKFIRFPGGCIIEGDGGLGADTTEVYDWKNSVGAVQTGTNAGDDDIPAFTYTRDLDGAKSSVTTRGEWVTREQNGDLWGYDMEYGIGFYEYFLLCDSLGASALPVLNCGYSCMGGAATAPKPLNGRHGKLVEDYIQDAIDLIEFAKGDKSTKWGSLRAAMGHEAPFEMDYIGIGNEQSGIYYTDYYEKFLQSASFQKAMTDYGVRPIVGNGMFFSDCQNPDQSGSAGTAQRAAQNALEKGIVKSVYEYGIHDQHYYVNWTELLENAAMYDGYFRAADDESEYYEVFVGEYSANEGENRAPGYPLYANSLQTALAEAAMMTNYEKNGDIVKLAAYAPMFASYAGTRQWPVDMMYYTNTQIVRTANYYVQQMFMQNTGDVVLRSCHLNWASGEESTVVLRTEGSGAATAKKKEVEKLYFVVSRTDAGDVIVKIVNISSAPVRCNIQISGAESVGQAAVTELCGGMKDTNTLGQETVKPATQKISWTGSSLGYELKASSLTILRISMK